jgi:hypothetical protein
MFYLGVVGLFGIFVVFPQIVRQSARAGVDPAWGRGFQAKLQIAQIAVGVLTVCGFLASLAARFIWRRAKKKFSARQAQFLLEAGISARVCGKCRGTGGSHPFRRQCRACGGNGVLATLGWVLPHKSKTRIRRFPPSGATSVFFGILGIASSFLAFCAPFGIIFGFVALGLAAVGSREALVYPHRWRRPIDGYWLGALALVLGTVVGIAFYSCILAQ